MVVVSLFLRHVNRIRIVFVHLTQNDFSLPVLDFSAVVKYTTMKHKQTLNVYGNSHKKVTLLNFTISSYNILSTFKLTDL